MVEMFVILAVVAIGGYGLLEIEARDWIAERLQQLRVLAEHNHAGPMMTWVAAVVLPALLVAAIDLLFMSHVHWLDFCFSLLVLLGTTALGSFLRIQRELLRFLYGNNPEMVAQAANAWDNKADSIVDGEESLVPRMLGLCALKLHEDVLLPVLCFAVLGPAGAALACAHQLYCAASPPDAPDWPRRALAWTAAPSIVVFAVVGNMVPALAVLPRCDVRRAALAATDNVAGAIDIEKVPEYGRFISRSLVVGVGGAALALFLLAL